MEDPIREVTIDHPSSESCWVGAAQCWFDSRAALSNYPDELVGQIVNANMCMTMGANVEILLQLPLPLLCKPIQRRRPDTKQHMHASQCEQLGQPATNQVSNWLPCSALIFRSVARTSARSSSESPVSPMAEWLGSRPPRVQDCARSRAYESVQRLCGFTVSRPGSVQPAQLCPAWGPQPRPQATRRGRAATRPSSSRESPWHHSSHRRPSSSQ